MEVAETKYIMIFWVSLFFIFIGGLCYFLYQPMLDDADTIKERIVYDFYYLMLGSITTMSILFLIDGKLDFMNWFHVPFILIAIISLIFMLGFSLVIAPVMFVGSIIDLPIMIILFLIEHIFHEKNNNKQ
jgi:hypothetical protein